MQSKTDQAIVLRTSDYGDADIIVSLFTKGEGRIAGMAKGAKKSKKRFGPALDIGSLIHLVYEERPHKELTFLKEASLLDVTQRWRSSWEAIAAVSFALELGFKLLPERQPSLRKFEVLKIFLASLEEANAVPLLFDFEFHWLQLSGWEPSLDTCGFCGIHFQKAKSFLEKQRTFDHYWAHVFGKPLVSRTMLELVLSTQYSVLSTG